MNKLSGRKRKQYTSQIKFKAILEVYAGKQVAEVARVYGFHPTMFSKWKAKFDEAGHHIFEDSKKDESKQKIEQLTSLIGKKEIEIELLKKFLGSFA